MWKFRYTMQTSLTADDLILHYKELYFCYMTIVPNGTFEDFKRIQIDFSSTILDRIHDKYADHVEGITKECLH